MTSGHVIKCQIIKLAYCLGLCRPAGLPPFLRWLCTPSKRKADGVRSCTYRVRVSLCHDTSHACYSDFVYTKVMLAIPKMR